jgi:hypothetical protein
MSGAKPFANRRLVDRSRMSPEAHVRFWEGVGVKLPRATHFVVLNETHLRRLLREYLIYYYRGARTHLSLAKDAPEPRPVERLDEGRIVETPMVGGLHHRYTRRAA